MTKQKKIKKLRTKKNAKPIILRLPVVWKTQRERQVELSSRLQELQSISVKKKIPIAIGTMGKAVYFCSPLSGEKKGRNITKLFLVIVSSENTRKNGLNSNLLFKKTVEKRLLLKFNTHYFHLQAEFHLYALLPHPFCRRAKVKALTIRQMQIA